MEKATGWLSEEELILHRRETFHRERVAALMAGQTPFKPANDKLLIVHLIPEQSVRSRVRLSVAELRKHAPNLRPFGQESGHSKINVDGIVSASGFDPVRSYTQMFRDGRVEAVMSGVAVAPANEKVFCLCDQLCEKAIIAAVANHIAFCKSADMKPPVWTFASLTGCKGVRARLQYGFPSDEMIDRDMVHLPEIAVADFAAAVATDLRPLFDALWNALGFERCLNYGEDGRRRERE